MIISLLSDPSVMNKKNFAEGYNVLTGKVDNHSANNKYGESKFGFIILLEIPKKTINGLVNLLGIERV
jgi:hypothetical protein